MYSKITSLEDLDVYQSQSQTSRSRSGIDHDARHDLYLLQLEERNKSIKKLKQKTSHQEEIELKEKGFSLYLNGANAERNISTTKIRPRSGNKVPTKSKSKESSLKTPRKTWGQCSFEIQTARSGKFLCSVNDAHTDYSHDFEDSSSDESSGELVMSVSDLNVLRSSLQDASLLKTNNECEIPESIEECESEENSEDAETEELVLSQHDTVVFKFNTHDDKKDRNLSAKKRFHSVKDCEVVASDVKNEDTSAFPTLLNRILQLDEKNRKKLLSVLNSISLSSNDYERDNFFEGGNINDRAKSGVVNVHDTQKTISLKECCEISFLSNWGHPSLIGLTEIEFLNEAKDCIPIENVVICLNGAPRNDLKILFNGKAKTTKDANMWKHVFRPNDSLTIKLHFVNDYATFHYIKIWNYNKSLSDLCIGVKRMKISINDFVWDGIVEKGCGNNIFDYSTLISIKDLCIIEPTEKKLELDNERLCKTQEILETYSIEKDTSCANDTDTLSYNKLLFDSYNQKDPVNVKTCFIPAFSKEEKSSCNVSVPNISTIHFDTNNINCKNSHSSSTSSLRESSVNSSRESPRSSPRKSKNPVIAARFAKEVPPKTSSEFNKISFTSTKPNAANSSYTLAKPIMSNLPDAGDNLVTERSISSRHKTEKGFQEVLSEITDESTKSTLASCNLPGETEHYINSTNERRSRRKDFKLKNSPIFDSLDVDTNQETHKSKPESINDTKQQNWINDILNEDLMSSINIFEKTHEGQLSHKPNPIENKCSNENSFSKPSHISLEQYGTMLENFIVPSLPSGSKLIIEVLTTWGDKFYVGLNGIEIFNSKGYPVEITSISAFPSDINVLPEYSKDPRVIANLIDGINNTRDDRHMWLTPFTGGCLHQITVDFKQIEEIAMLRIWNYNKSRVHSCRGVKDIVVTLDDKVIFVGEILRAGTLSENGIEEEVFAETILYTINEQILEVISQHDELFLSNCNFSSDDEADEKTERPKTTENVGSRPLTRLDDLGILQKKSSRCYTATTIKLQIISTWGDVYYVGLTGLQLLDSNQEPIQLLPHMLTAQPRDITCLSECQDDPRVLTNLLNDNNVTSVDKFMWLAPYDVDDDHWIKITLDHPQSISGLRVWNYNKSWDDSHRGIRLLRIFVDDNLIQPSEGFTIRKAPGNCYFDFSQDILFEEQFKQYISLQNWHQLHSLNSENLPCGFVFTFVFNSNHGDHHYIGLNGLEIFDDLGRSIPLNSSHIAAYPESINCLPQVDGDLRTPDKLVDGVNTSNDGRHSWLTPFTSNNRVYIVFDYPVAVSMLRIWNYSKTPTRGVKDFMLMVDDLSVYQSSLPICVTSRPGIIPGLQVDQSCRHSTILFSQNNEQLLLQEKHHLIHAREDSYQNATVSEDFLQLPCHTTDLNVQNRPKTCVLKN